MTAVQILCNGTMEAAVLMLLDKGKAKAEIDPGKLSEALKKVLKENVQQVLSEWEELVEANMGEAFNRNFMNVQCNELAVKALKEGGWL